MMREADARPFFPSIERVAIERVACTEPGAYGLEITRWDCRTLQEIVIEEAIVDSIHYTTVARILAAASLQPHRSCYWKTATIDSEFMRRATQVLWCYENVERLYERGDVIICVDEKPNIQALERRAPTKPPCSGQSDMERSICWSRSMSIPDRCGHIVWTKMIINIFFGLCGKSRDVVLGLGEFI